MIHIREEGKNEAGYMDKVACEWAGAVIKMIEKAFGQL